MVWIILGFIFFSGESLPDTFLDGSEWPVLARTRDRNQAYMIKALLDDSNIESIVEEDTTMGVLYGLPGLTDYPIKVPEQKYNQARGILKESSFDEQLTDQE